MSIVATNDSLIRGNFLPLKERLENLSNEDANNMQIGIYPPLFHYLRDFGIYVFRFFKDFKWRYVRINLNEYGRL